MTTKNTKTTNEVQIRKVVNDWASPTFCLQKLDNYWKIVHQRASMPININVP